MPTRKEWADARQARDKKLEKIRVEIGKLRAEVDQFARDVNAFAAELRGD